MALGKSPPLFPSEIPVNQRRHGESARHPSEWLGEAGGRDALWRGLLACLPRTNRSTGLKQADMPHPEPEDRTFHRRPKTRQTNPKPQTPQPNTPPTPSPPSPPSIELEAEVGAGAPTSASVLLSPSPLKALRERGTKGVRVPFRPRAIIAPPERRPPCPTSETFYPRSPASTPSPAPPGPPSMTSGKAQSPSSASPTTAHPPPARASDRAPGPSAKPAQTSSTTSRPPSPAPS